MDPEKEGLIEKNKEGVVLGEGGEAAGSETAKGPKRRGRRRQDEASTDSEMSEQTKYYC